MANLPRDLRLKISEYLSWRDIFNWFESDNQSIPISIIKIVRKKMSEIDFYKRDVDIYIKCRCGRKCDLEECIAGMETNYLGKPLLDMCDECRGEMCRKCKIRCDYSHAVVCHKCITQCEFCDIVVRKSNNEYCNTCKKSVCDSCSVICSEVCGVFHCPEHSMGEDGSGLCTNCTNCKNYKIKENIH